MAKVNGKGQATVLTNDQIDRVLDLCRGSLKPILAIAAYTGCRMGEAIALRAENLDLNGKLITLTHTKTGKVREIPIHPELLTVLEKASLPDEGWLFPSPRTASHVTRQAIDKELREICEALGIRGVGTHSFRRSLATNLHAKGQPLKVIAAITGHASLDSLSRYIDVSSEQTTAAILNLR